MHGERRTNRNVIPRWRPLAGILLSDLESNKRYPDAQIPTFSREDFIDRVAIWRKEEPIIRASELFDTYLLTGDNGFLSECTSLIKENDKERAPKLLEEIRRSIEPSPDPLSIRHKIAFSETSSNYVHRSIALMKRHLAEFPRDGLSYLELARLYTILGQFRNAEGALATARALAPENRVILRATIQFYDVVEALEDGLKIIQRSDRLRFDPWVQSAEIAAATLAGKGSKAAISGMLREKAKGALERSRTELGMAMATLECANGLSERKVFGLVKRALPNSTENGFAQAIWLSDQSTREFSNRFPDATPSDDAFEAKVDLSLNNREFFEASGYAELWLEDQPFSAHAAIRYLYIRSILLEPDEKTLSWASRAMQVHSDDWSVLNAVAIALTKAGKFHEARTAIDQLGRHAPKGTPRAFYHAAQGFLAFHSGDFQFGRTCYEQAGRIIREERDYPLSVNASIFWFGCEALNGLMSVESISEMTELIERAIRKVRSPEKEFMTLAWEVTKTRINDEKVSEETVALEPASPVRQFILEFDRD